MLVLIVEDDPLVAMDLEDAVVEHTLATVIIGATVKTTWPLLDEPVDMAFIDIDLTDGKTHQLAKMLQDRNVPVVFVSGSPRSELPECLRKAPFVPKPFSHATLGRAIARVAPKPEYAAAG